jgi:hypothetical protein
MQDEPTIPIKIDDVTREYYLLWNKYATTNQIRLDLLSFDDEVGTYVPYYTATVNAEHVELEEDDVVIKDYSENEGLLKGLVKAGIVNKPHGKISRGHTFAYICQLTDNYK